MQSTSAQLHFARCLRRESTDAGRLLWFHLRDRRLGVKFRRQQPVGPFIVDFLSVEAALVIELDGSQHGAALDAGRTRFLERRGLRALRVCNHDALVHTEAVLEQILAIVARIPTPAPGTRADARVFGVARADGSQPCRLTPNGEGQKRPPKLR